MHACEYDTETFTSNPASFVARAFGNVVRGFAERSAAQRLMSLDDHLLRDIGVSRDDVERLARTGRPVRR